MNKSSWSTIVCMLLVVTVLAGPVPATADEGPEDLLERNHDFIVGFRGPVDGFQEGDTWEGAQVMGVNEAIRFITVRTEDPEIFELRASSNHEVRYIEEDPMVDLLLESKEKHSEEGSPVEALFTPNDPQYGNQYGPQQVRADLAWDTTLGSADAAVCVIDTGVRYTHEDLQGTRWLGGHDFVNGDTDPMDDNGHGTHVAGTAAAGLNNGIGISGMGNTGIYGVKVLDSAGFGSWSNVANAITWCADNTIDRTVISMSLGASSSTQAVEDAVDYAFLTKDKLVVSASGNDGPCTDCVNFPAKFANSMAVGCTTSSEGLCSFSSTGPEVDIVAPGSGILSTWHTSDTAYHTISGTSMSTPHVSGAAALYWSQDATISAADLWDRLRDSAQDLGDPGRDNSYGCGELDAKDLFDGVGTCGSGTEPGTPIFMEDFDDNNADGWSLDGLWRLTDCRSFSSSFSLGYNEGPCPPDYDVGTTAGNAVTQAVSIPSDATSARLVYQSWYETESTGTTYDKKLVHVSTDGGSTWDQLEQVSGTMSTWTERDVDLSAYIGQTINLRFRFDSMDGIGNAYEGWYLDDVTVEAVLPDSCSSTPTNACFDDAIVYSDSPFQDTGDTTGADEEPGEPSPCAGIASTVWYRFTATNNGQATIDTFGSSYDTALAAYTGSSVDSLTTVTCNDDSGGTFQSQIGFTCVAGETYHIQLGGFAGNTGAYQMNHDGCIEPPCDPNPANNCFDDAIVYSDSPFQDTGDTTGADEETGEPSSCAGIASTVWYRFTATNNGQATIDTFGSSYDTALAAYTGSSVDSLTTVACNDDSGGTFQSQIGFTCVAGETYHIQIGGWFGSTGAYQLNHEGCVEPPCDPNPANNCFDDAIVYSDSPFQDTGDTTGADQETGEPSPCAGIASTVWYRFTATNNGQATIDTFGSSYDTVLAAYTGSSVGSLTTVTCNDDSGGTLQSQIGFTCVAGETYHIQIGGWFGITGTYQLNHEGCMGDTVQPPSQPLNLVAGAGPGVGEISLDWDPPTNDGGSPITGYNVYGADASGGPFTQIGTTDSATQQFTETGLGNGQTRYYQVTAENNAGESSPSNEASATTFDTASAPLNLVAGAGPGVGEISLAWDPPTDDGGAPVTGYNVYGADASGGPFTQIGTTDSATQQFTETGLGNDQTRYYQVTAVNNAGEGDASNEASATTFDTPSAPLNLVAGAGPGVGEISLDWDPPTDDGGLPVSGYRIYGSDTSGGPFTQIGTTGSGTQQFTETGLGNDQTRYYQVTAENNAGEGDASNEASATTFDTPSAPLNLAANAGPGAGEISLAWDPPTDDGGTPVTGYNVYGADASGGPFTLIGTTGSGTQQFTETGLGNDQTRYYQVTAENNAGEGDPSAEDGATTFREPSPPRNLKAEPGSAVGAIELSWVFPADDGGTPVTAYGVYRSTSISGPYSLVTTVPGSTFEYTDSGDLLTTYYYRTTALNIAGESIESNTACSKPYPWTSLGNDNLCGVPSP